MKELSKQDIEVVLAGKGLPGELLAGESLAKYFARLYLHTKDSRDEQLSQRDAQIAALKADFIRLDRQMSVLEQTGITDRDRADKAEAQIAELANQEPVAWRIGGDGCPEHLSGDKKYAYAYPRRTIEPLFTRAAPPAPVIDPITVKALWPNPVRWDYQSEREYLGAMSMLKDCETVIKAAGGSVADE